MDLQLPKPALIAAISTIPLFTACGLIGPKDSVHFAMQDNAARFDVGEPRLQASRFLVEMADARLLGAAQGRVAADRASSPEVRAYAAKMVREQAVLLEEIRALAAAQAAVLPDRVSDAKSARLEQLRECKGRKLDEAFLSMICTDRARDVEAFRQASELHHLPVRNHARERLPLIEDHLAEARALKERHSSAVRTSPLPEVERASPVDPEGGQDHAHRLHEPAIGAAELQRDATAFVGPRL